MGILKALVNVYCRDMARAEAFYGGTLGLSETYRFPREGVPEHVEYAVGAATVAISSPNGLASHGMPAPSPGHPFELVFKVEDVDAMVEQLRVAGVTVLRAPFDTAAGNRSAYVADPEGNWIALYHNR